MDKKVPPHKLSRIFPDIPAKKVGREMSKIGGKCREMSKIGGKCREMSGNVGKSENVEISYNERGQCFHLPRRIDIESHCQNLMFMIII